MQKHIRVEDDDPNRCQAIAGNRQCPYKANEQSKYCSLHGGNLGSEKAEKIQLRNLRLTKFYARAHELAESDQAKSLRDEIGVTRMILEEKLLACTDPSDLIINGPQITMLIEKIDKLVNSAHKLESNLGELLDRAAVVQLTGQIVEIINESVSALIDRLVSDMGQEYEDKIVNIINGEFIDQICDALTIATVKAGKTGDRNYES